MQSRVIKTHTSTREEKRREEKRIEKKRREEKVSTLSDLSHTRGHVSAAARSAHTASGTDVMPVANFTFSPMKMR